LERRRRQAFALIKSGIGLKEVARRVGVSLTSVCRWQLAVQERGPAALKAKPASGRPRRLSDNDRTHLLDILIRGAAAYGFPNDLWTLKRIAAVIRREFGVIYHPNHLWRFLRRAGWSCQVPERRANQRDEEAIAHWKRHKWPHIKKGATTWGPSGFPR
jgi:transposase